MNKHLDTLGHVKHKTNKQTREESRGIAEKARILIWREIREKRFEEKNRQRKRKVKNRCVCVVHALSPSSPSRLSSSLASSLRPTNLSCISFMAFSMLSLRSTASCSRWEVEESSWRCCWRRDWTRRINNKMWKEKKNKDGNRRRRRRPKMETEEARHKQQTMTREERKEEESSWCCCWRRDWKENRTENKRREEKGGWRRCKQDRREKEKTNKEKQENERKQRKRRAPNAVAEDGTEQEGEQNNKWTEKRKRTRTEPEDEVRSRAQEESGKTGQAKNNNKGWNKGRGKFLTMLLKTRLSKKENRITKSGRRSEEEKCKNGATRGTGRRRTKEEHISGKTGH